MLADKSPGWSSVAVLSLPTVRLTAVAGGALESIGPSQRMIAGRLYMLMTVDS
jgi:hypothetical protein